MKKLSILQDKLNGIYKGSTQQMGQRKVSYATIVEVMDKANEAMKDMGLISVVNFEPIDGIEPIKQYQTTSQSGYTRNMFLVVGMYKITIVDTDTQEREVFSTIAAADMDNSSATSGSVMTYFDRYLWSKILRVPFTTEKEVEEMISQTMAQSQPQIKTHQQPQQSQQPQQQSQPTQPTQQPQPEVTVQPTQAELKKQAKDAITEHETLAKLVESKTTEQQQRIILTHYKVLNIIEIPTQSLRDLVDQWGLQK